jgi:drug/metabolite transporter (DMT)-like permease
MSADLLALILLAAALHATWNFFAKRSGGSLAVIWLGAVISSLATIPTAIAFQRGHPLSHTGLAVACTSGVVHCVYWWALAGMYRYGDISLAYPIARGGGVLGTALGSVLFERDPLSATGAAGIALVCVGVFALGYQKRRERVRTRAITLAIVTAFSIAAYSLLDDHGVQMVDPAVYLALETGVGAVLLGLADWKRLRKSVPIAYRKHKLAAWIIGVGSPVTYLIILFAFKRGPVSYIVAVREFSVVLASLLGARFLHERMGLRRWAAIAVVFAGMVLIKLA